MKFIKKYPFFFLVLLLSANTAAAQRLSRDEIEKKIEKDGCVVVEEGKVEICKFDYTYKSKRVEALTFKPGRSGKFPSLMLIPGYQGTPRTYLTLGTIFAKLGFASVSVGTPGFGKTELEADFLGKNTIEAYLEGFKKFALAPFVDRERIGIFGYSRGALAASLMITRLRDAKAAVLGGGIYDLKKAYDELTIEGIRENIRKETGLKKKALRKRSSIFKMANVNCPVLIIHGENDLNAPTGQAYLLRDKLRELNKPFEFQILAGHAHGNLGGDFLRLTIDFLSRKLKGEASGVKFS